MPETLKPQLNRATMRITLFIIAACIASLGTIPYGYHFTDFFSKPYPLLAIIMGIILAAAGAIANAALGTYSLMQFNIRQKVIPLKYLLTLSILNAVTIGCINFFGYENIVPLTINILITFGVMTTNAAIAYTAITNMATDLRSRVGKHIQPDELSVSIIGFTLGTLVSMTGYMATIRALRGLFEFYLSAQQSYYLALAIGFLVWLSFAGLFGNSTQLCFESIYKWLKNPDKKSALSTYSIAIMVFSLLSAASYTQMVITFFDKNLPIPDFFKQEYVQFFIYKFLVPFSIFTASSVNYLALTRLIKVAKPGFSDPKIAHN